MIDLDERLDNAVTELRHVLATAQVTPATKVVSRYRHRRIGAAMTAALVVVATGVAIVGRIEGTDGTHNVASAEPSSALPLLFPPNQSPAVIVVPAPAGRYSALVSSPTGRLFTINVMENFWGEFPANTPTRTVNGRTFGLDGPLSYTLLTTCSMTVTLASTPDAPGNTASAWEPDVLALLSAESVDHGVNTVTLPTGWAVVTQPNAQATAYQYSVNIGGGHGRASIWVVPGATAAAIFGAYGPPDQIRRIDFDGHPAWFSSVRATAPGASETNYHLTWEAGGNAYDIVARTATEEQLVAFARTLAPAAIGDLKDINGAAGSVATTATLASEPTPTGACRPRSLVINS